MQLAGLRVEVKTASLGANGTFQFNHVRLDKPYQYLLCLGICPKKLCSKCGAREKSLKEALAI
jgi:hypothetical protein